MVLATWRVSEYKHWMDGTEGTGILTRNPLTGPTELELPSRQRPNPTYREQKESEDDSAREIMENKVQKKVAEGNRARSSHKASCQLFKRTHSRLL